MMAYLMDLIKRIGVGVIFAGSVGVAVGVSVAIYTGFYTDCGAGCGDWIIAVVVASISAVYVGIGVCGREGGG